MADTKSNRSSRVSVGIVDDDDDEIINTLAHSMSASSDPNKTPVISINKEEPPFKVNGQKIVLPQEDRLPKRDTNSLRREFKEFSSKHPSAKSVDTVGPQSNSHNARRSSGANRRSSKYHNLRNSNIATTMVMGVRKSDYVDMNHSSSSHRSERDASKRHHSNATDREARSSRMIHAGDETRETLYDDLSEDEEFQRMQLLVSIGNRQRKYPWLLLAENTRSYDLERLKYVDDFTQKQVNIHEKIVGYNFGILVMMMGVHIFGSRFLHDDFKEIIHVLLDSYHSFRGYVMEMCEKNMGKAFYADWHPLLKIFGMMVMKIGLFLIVKQVCRLSGVLFTQEKVKKLEKIVVDFDKHPDEPADGGGFGQMGTIAKFASVILGGEEEGASKDKTADGANDANQGNEDEIESFLNSLPKTDNYK